MKPKPRPPLTVTQAKTLAEAAYKWAHRATAEGVAFTNPKTSTADWEKKYRAAVSANRAFTAALAKLTDTERP